MSDFIKAVTELYVQNPTLYGLLVTAVALIVGGAPGLATYFLGSRTPADTSEVPAAQETG